MPKNKPAKPGSEIESRPEKYNPLKDVELQKLMVGHLLNSRALPENIQPQVGLLSRRLDMGHLKAPDFSNLCRWYAIHCPEGPHAEIARKTSGVNLAAAFEIQARVATH